MNLSELMIHIAEIEYALAIKKEQLDYLLLTDPAQGMQVRYQIECLEPRVAELRRHAHRLAKEREAHAVAV